MTVSTGVPATGSADGRQWRRSVRVLGLVAAVVVAAGTISDLDDPLPTALLLLGLALWIVELLDTPRVPHLELPLLAVVGCCGGALNALAPESAGFLFAYFAAAGLGLRFAIRQSVPAIALVVVVLAGGILLGDRPHPTASLTTSLLGVGFAYAVAAATRNARLAHARAESLVIELEASRSAQAEAAALAERARLAREIHDVLAHALSGQVMSLEAAGMLAARTGADQRLITEIDRAQRLARDGLVDAREAIAALRGDVLPGPDRVPTLVDEAGPGLGLIASFEARGVPRTLSAEAGLAVYRTTQEALTNTAKHAGRGARVSVVLAWGPESMSLTVTDNAGTLSAEPVPSGGYGITGLRERAELAGGNLTAEPTATGFKVTLDLPYEHPTEPKETS
jgi:signal transduction histidine kinase